jgi:hypothetical protein
MKTTLEFPSRAVVSRVLDRDVLPEAMAGSPLCYREAADGRLWVQATGRMTAPLKRRLARFGVQAGGSRDRLEQEAPSWDRVAALVPRPVAVTRTTAALLLVPEASRWVSEMIRLGNDRIGHATLPDGRDLLQVYGIPYYTLLGAVADPAVEVLVEAKAGVWVAAGWRQPRVAAVVPSAAGWWWITPAGWVEVPIPSFADIYAVTTWAGAGGTTAVVPTEPPSITVPWRLVRSEGVDRAEFWVTPEVAAVDRWVGRLEESLRSCYLFAVGEAAGRPVAVLKRRPGMTAAEPEGIGGVAYRPYLRLTNLYVPVGQRVSPVLRRDTVVQHLAAEPTLTTWLAPAGPDGTFEIERLPDSNFQPLTAWVDWALDRDRDQVTQWLEACAWTG